MHLFPAFSFANGPVQFVFSSTVDVERLKAYLFQNCFQPVSLFHTAGRFTVVRKWCVGVVVCVCGERYVGVASAIVKRPVFPFYVEDGRCTNFRYYYY